MAYAQSVRTAPAGAGISGFVAGVADRVRRYRIYRNTMTELGRLSARELDDLGLNGSMIRSCAYKAAYES